jgi:allophanate hydrolase
MPPHAPMTTNDTARSTALPAPRSADDAHQRIEETLRRLDAYTDNPVWITRLTRDQIEHQLESSIDRQSAGIPQPLFGLTFAIKDNIDYAAVPTTAACADFAYTPAASAAVVAKLCDAGAIAVGKTNMDQFATGLVGTRSPYGVVRNPFNPDYISGGSSSGSAVAVAAGMVDFALGTDTAGSGRVPAAFCNLVGLKPTRGLLSTTGVVPACRSLDCVSIFAHSCDDAAKVFNISRGFDATDIFSRRTEELPGKTRDANTSLASFRFGIPQDWQLEFFGNHDAEWMYRRAISHAVSIGGTAVEFDYSPFLEAAKQLYGGPWTAERYLAAKELLERNPDAILPVTRGIIENAIRFTAADAFAAQYKLLELRRRAEREWQKIDVLLLPTTGTIYTIAEVQTDAVRLNTNLGYYTNFVNLLDLCAVAVPNGFQPNGLPMGVTFMAPAGADDWLLKLAARFESSNVTGEAAT